tara:strand:+ start:348 stop:1040 length:693 start_codon:yes stop_codon:yes gene_type:complete
MPFCTIEEAWAPSLKLESSNKNYTGYEQYNSSEINLENSELYDSKGKSLRVKKKKRKKKKKPNFSRSYNRLPEHSGPSTRLPRESQKRLSRKRGDNTLDMESNYPNYMNGDLPINDINSYTEQRLKDAYDVNIKQINKSSLKEDFFDIESNTKTNDGITQDSSYNEDIKEIIKENLKLKDIIKDLKLDHYNNNNTRDKTDNYIELFIFIFTGIIIIFILDNLTNLLKSRY